MIPSRKDKVITCVRGDRSATLATVTGMPTNLRIQRRDKYWTANILCSSNAFASVGNPYPSYLILRRQQRPRPSRSISTVWNPLLSGVYGVTKPIQKKLSKVNY
jgi:hypothetical protein